jgi:hypothetical protein
VVVALLAFAKPALADGNLQYAGGPVQHNPTLYAIFWLPSGHHFAGIAGDSLYEAVLTSWLRDAHSTNLANVASQYGDNADYSRPGTTFGGSWTDTTDYPHSGSASDALTDADIQASIRRAMTANGWHDGVNATFFVFTGADINFCDPFGDCTPEVTADSHMCGYHYNQGDTVYAVLSDATTMGISSDGGACFSVGDFLTPFPFPAAELVVPYLAHEQFEAQVNPKPNGDPAWYDSAHPTDPTEAEIADKCAPAGGNPYGYAAYDLLYQFNVGGRLYHAPQLWSNVDGACRGSDLIDDFYLFGPFVAFSGRETAFTFAQTIDSPNLAGANKPTIDWGDGTASTVTLADDCRIVCNLSGSHTYATAGTYTVTLTYYVSAFNTVHTTTTHVFVEGEAITAEPADQTVTAGQTATFTAEAVGTPIPDVQWQLSTDQGGTFTDLPGATSPTLSFTASQSQNGYRYRAVFTNTGGSRTTKAAILTVQTPPSVTAEPADQTVAEGANDVTFTAAASGDPLPTVRWQVSTDGGVTFTDMTQIGADSATLHLSRANPNLDGTQYRAVFTNAAGSVTTRAATLTVIIHPTVTTQPADLSVFAGETATFTAAVSGSPAAAQWQVSTDNGATFTDIEGATSASYSFTASLSQNGYEYQAVFTNAAGHATTRAATLTVATPPDAKIQIGPPATTGPAGSTQTLTGHLDVASDGTTFSSAPAGTTISFSVVSGPGSFVGGVNTCATAGTTGSCAVQISSPAAGTTVVRAAAEVTLSGVLVHRETGDGRPGESADAQIVWQQLAQTIAFSSAPPDPALPGGSYTPSATGGGSGNPVVFSIDSSSSTGACSLAGGTVTFTGPGTCILDANQAGDATYLAAPQAQQTITIPETQTSGGSSSGSVTVGPGTALILSGAQVSGRVTVDPGGILIVKDGSISGSLTSSGAALIELCGSRVSGRVSITNTTGAVILGDGTAACAPNTLSGAVTITGGQGGVEFDANTLSGPLTITGNSGALAPPGTGAVDAEGNTISGAVMITGNSGGVVFDTNTVSGSLTITDNTGTLPPPRTGAVEATDNRVSGRVNVQP